MPYPLYIDITYCICVVTGFEIFGACCGTGLIGVGRCNNNTPFICSDSSKYVFWDAIHPNLVYEIFAKLAIDRDLPSLF
jgi:hypothetical protein